LVDVPDPVAVLDALLSDSVSPPSGSEPGCAQALPGVAPAVLADRERVRHKSGDLCV